jgi:hypothetical protein
MNSTNNNNCKTKEKMDYYLKSTYISFEMQDIELTPLNYSYPVRGRDVDIYSTVGKKLFQEIHVFFQIVNIETDLDPLGLSEFQNVRREKYLKYDSLVQMTNILENDLYETGESFCNVTIKLTEKVLTEKRRYTKLVEVLRDVGGFMEVMLFVFKIVSFFSTNILYEKSLVNCLFEFDINKKIVIVHNKYQNELKESNNIQQKHSNKNNYKLDYKNLYNDVIITSKNNLNSNMGEKRNYENSFNSKTKNIKIIRNNFQRKYFTKRRINKSNILKSINEEQNNNINIVNLNNEIIENDKKNYLLVEKIRINKFCLYFCFLCVRKRKNMENILLDEGMRIIIEKLDIINIFKNLCKDDIDLSEKNIIKMSNNCIKGLEEINNSYCNT